MKRTEPVADFVALDETFATTRRLVADEGLLRVYGLEKSNPDIEGGLRVKGYFKRSEPQKPLITVITVVYNGAEQLEDAILSVTGQAYDNVEYIIIDGGSIDGTIEVIKKYDDALDYWISEPDEGIYDAMNKGVHLSRGDYVLFLGSDDRLFEVFLEAVNYFDEETMSYYGNVVMSKNKSLYDGMFYPLKLFIKNIPHQAIFYSKQVFNQYQYNCRYLAVADYELNLKVFSDDKLGLKYMPVTVAVFNNKDGVSSTVTDRNFSIDKPDLIYRYYSRFHYIIYMFLRSFLRRR